MNKNNKMKLLVIPFLILLVSFLNISGVSADSSTATCIYYPFSNIKTITLTYTYSADAKISYKLSSMPGSSYKVSSSTVMASNFLLNGKITCPTLYASKTNQNNRGADLIVSTNVTNLSNPVTMNPDSSLSKTVTGTTKSYTCSFEVNYPSYKGITEEVTIVASEGKITSINATTANVITSNQDPKISYVDVFNTDGSCKNPKQFEAYCVYTRPDSSCYVTKDAPAGFGSEVVPIENETLNMTGNEIKELNSTVNIDFQSGFLTCDTFTEILDFSHDIFQAATIFVAVGLVILGMLDFGKAVMSDKPEAMQKAIKSFRTRIIIFVIILLLPSLLNMLFSIFTGSEFSTIKETCIPGI